MPGSSADELRGKVAGRGDESPGGLSSVGKAARPAFGCRCWREGLIQIGMTRMPLIPGGVLGFAKDRAGVGVGVRPSVAEWGLPAAGPTPGRQVQGHGWARVPACDSGAEGDRAHEPGAGRGHRASLQVVPGSLVRWQLGYLGHCFQCVFHPGFLLNVVVYIF